MNTTAPNADSADAFDPALWRVVAVVNLGPFMSNLDATIVNVSLSSLAQALHSTVETIQWVTSGYLLSLALMLPLSGWLVDRIGAKRLYLGCFSAFTISSLLCASAWSTDSLIGFRVLQGMAGGLLAPMAQMMMARVAGRHMARVIGYSVVPLLLGSMFGPVLAGVILQHLSWRWLFYINLPVGLLAVALALRFLPSDHATLRPRTFDFRGFAMLSPGLVSLLYGIDHPNGRLGIAALAIACVLIPAFILHAARKGTGAIIDVGLFRNRIFFTAAITQFLTNGLVFSGQMLVPLYLTLACHLSVTRTGWMMGAVGLGMLCTAPFMGAVTGRFGLRNVAAAGALAAGVALAPLIYMAQHRLSIALLLSALFVRGAGLGSINIPSMSAAYASIAKEDLPMATTSVNLVQRTGGPLLTTLVSIFLAWNMRMSHFGPQLIQPFAAAFVLLFLFHVLSIVATLRLPTFASFVRPVTSKPQ